jgi:hypothetical protein
VRAWASSIQSTPPHSTSWRSIVILFTHLRLGLLSGSDRHYEANSRCWQFCEQQLKTAFCLYGVVCMFCVIRYNMCCKGALPNAEVVRCGCCHMHLVIMLVTVGNAVFALGLYVCLLLCHRCLHSIRIFVVNKDAFSRNVSVIWVKRLSGQYVQCKFILDDVGSVTCQFPYSSWQLIASIQLNAF